MNEVKETPKGQPLPVEKKEVKQPYQKPESTVVQLELEQPILQGSFDRWDPARW